MKDEKLCETIRPTLTRLEACALAAAAETLLENGGDLDHEDALRSGARQLLRVALDR